jgi:riboflavin kinase/FMN adenylyltransferase
VNTFVDASNTIVVGEFDGLHIGHRHLIDAARRLADRAREPLVGVVLAATDRNRQLLSVGARLEGLLHRGCDAVVAVDPLTATPDGIDLIDRIVEGTRPARAVLACPPLPHDRLAHPALRSALAARGVSVIEVERVTGGNGVVVTSAAIRAAVSTGDVALAAEWLGAPYALRGVVVHGARLGHTIGFPTANLEPPGDLVVPANGVYAGHVTTAAGGVFAAAVNVGVRPTVADDGGVRIEAHLLGFDADIYDQSIEIRFERRLRAEQRFESLDALVDQLGRDVRAVSDGPA